jgi:Arc/MetJ family transcription regulator
LTVTQIDLDDDALQQTMALSGARTKKDAVNLALRYYAEQQERAARVAHHFERAQHWAVVQEAERAHHGEKAADQR